MSNDRSRESAHAGSLPRSPLFNQSQSFRCHSITQPNCQRTRELDPAIKPDRPPLPNRQGSCSGGTRYPPEGEESGNMSPGHLGGAACRHHGNHRIYRPPTSLSKGKGKFTRDFSEVFALLDDTAACRWATNPLYRSGCPLQATRNTCFLHFSASRRDPPCRRRLGSTGKLPTRRNSRDATQPDSGRGR